MTSRERLLTVLRGEIPDCVPVNPDMSQMIPCRLMGKPFWDYYVFHNPPPWVAYINAVKHFGFDSLWDSNVPVPLPTDTDPDAPEQVEVIVDRNEERICTQFYTEDGGKKTWSEFVRVYRHDDPPAWAVAPEKLGLPPVPTQWQPIERCTDWPTGPEALKLAKEMMGDHGLVGVSCGTSVFISTPEKLYDYHDNPKPWHDLTGKLLDKFEKRFHALMALDVKPDFICTGGSGTLIMQTPQMVRELTLPIVKRMTRLAKEAGIFSHVHSCGPAKELVKMFAEETDLTVIDPLEIPPMGNCILKDLKEQFGDRIVLKGNLNTTLMLRGSVEEIRAAARQAIDDAKEGGRFILSTGDQCGRDTPDENIFAMLEEARTYGRYG